MDPEEIFRPIKTQGKREDTAIPSGAAYSVLLLTSERSRCERFKDLKGVHEPDSAWGWFICVVGLTSSIIIFGFLFSFGVLNPVFLDEFREGKARTGVVLFV